MDNPQIKERSYRIVHAMRLRNDRENRLLHEKLYSKQGLHTTYVNELNAVSREQERIRKELSRIRKTMATTWGALPVRDPAERRDDSRPHPAAARADPERFAPVLDPPMDRKRRRKASNRGRRDRILANRDSSTDDASRPSVGDTESERNTGKREEKSDAETLTLPSLSDDVIKTSDDKENEPVGRRKNDSAFPDPDAVRAKPASTKRGNPDVLSERNVDQAKGKIRKRLAGGGRTDEASSGSVPPSTRQQNVDEQKSRRSNRRPILTPIEEREQEETAPGTTTEVTSSSEQLRQRQQQNDKDKKAYSDGDSRETTSKDDRKRRNSEPTAFDSDKYNPDGSIRTVHVMPDMKSRLTEARKARYIRHNQMLERERELSITEILGKKDKQNRKPEVEPSDDGVSH